MRNSETDLGKLTLSFDHSVSSVRPVTVRIESFDARKRRTGGLAGMVYPAAPDFYLWAALELSVMRPFGPGGFRPTEPFVRLTFQISRLRVGAADAGPVQLRIDNVCYASPADYISPQGSDANNGRTEETALADSQKAMGLAQPGDIILLVDGTYHRAPTSPTLVYLEVRGLHIHGLGDTTRTTHPELIGKVDPLTSCNGIGCGGDHEATTPHHLRFADNLVEYCAGGGIGPGDCDWVTIYADSGISIGSRKHFDAADNVYKTLIRNNIVSGNRYYEKWKSANRLSDGNGIIGGTVTVSGTAYTENSTVSFGSFSVSVAAVPEPTAWVALLVGMMGVGLLSVRVTLPRGLSRICLQPDGPSQ